ncbi:hypothetical protein MKX01_033177 [Papaver californicum]|nr:hypothetical protein MKX01_033177 [Papaver californicum]
MNLPPRLGGSQNNKRKQANFKFTQKKMIWKPKFAISDNNNMISTSSDNDRVMDMLLPSKKIVYETSDATTLMIRNIPSKYTREMLTNLLEDHCKMVNEIEAKESAEEKDNAYERLSAFDFLYLPIDFKTGCNKGYAFVNMINSSGAKKLGLFLDNYRWSVYQSKKICKFTDAKYQGKEALVKHFSNSYFECESDNFLPRCFSPYRDGSGGFVEESTVGRFCVTPHHQNDDGCIKQQPTSLP